MELTNEQKQAIQFGVPMPETCKDLEWQLDTTFYWEFRDNNYYLRGTMLNNGNFTPAPQMHEIAIHLKGFDIEFSAKHLLYYGEVYPIGETLIHSIEVKDFHFAQAYAELYIKLKNEGLLK